MLFQKHISSVQLSRSVLSNSLRCHGLQHARLRCSSLTPKACSNSMSIKSLMPSNHLILCHPLLLLPLIFPSIRVFPNELTLCIKWSNYWSLSFSIRPSNEYSVLIFFVIDKEISLQPKGLSRVFSNTTVQNINSPYSAFFIVQLSHPYIPTIKKTS